MIPALLFAGPLFGIAFAQSEGNGTLIGGVQVVVEGNGTLIGGVQVVVDPPKQGQTLPQMNLSEGLLLGDQPVSIPAPPVMQQNHQKDIPEALPIGDQVSGDASHTPATGEQTLSDALAVSDGGIEAKVVKGSVALSLPIRDNVTIGDSVSHGSPVSSVNKVTTNIEDSIKVDAITVWNRAGHGSSPTSSPSPSPNPTPTGQTGNPVPQKASRLTRSIVDAITMDDVFTKRGPIGAVMQEQLRVVDNIAVSGLVVPPSPPKISVTAAPILQVTPDQSAEMTFHSTTSGTYSISIKSDDGGHVVRTIDGKMSLGANSATWDGNDGQGNMATAGSYSYYIRAQNAGGVREPPAEGDGAIVVVGGPKAPGQVQLPTDMSYWLILPIVAAAGVASFLFLRRRRPLTFYLPDEASPVIDDIRSRYPNAAVEDYVETTEEGVRRFKGVTIRSGKADDEWMEEIADRVKKLAGVDSLNVNYKGKTMTL